MLTTVKPDPSVAAGYQTADAVIADLVQALGKASVVMGLDLRDRNVRDWSKTPFTLPVALVLPRNPQEVAVALGICHRHSWPVSIQGGLTGLAGGANPAEGEIALSLSRLNVLEDIDLVGGTAVVQAGVTLEDLHAAVSDQGWFFPLDLGARGSCQLGGNAATNAGGNRVLRYGTMRHLVLGMEVVLADGTILSMLDRVIKNNAGFDLKQLFMGAEGSLGVITRLSLMLVPKPEEQCTVLCGVPNFWAALALLRHAKSALPGLCSFELMWDDFFCASAKVLGVPKPIFSDAYPLYVLIETLAGPESGSTVAMERFLEHAIEQDTVMDAVVAQSGTQISELWAYRESVSELLSIVKPCATFDVSVAIPKMNELVNHLRETLNRQYPLQQHLFFGHLGDGNLHLISGPFSVPGDLEAVEKLVYGCVEQFEGSISAEHGIGTAKREFLPCSRSAAQIDVMRKLKQVLDPLQILNRGRIFS